MLAFLRTLGDFHNVASGVSAHYQNNFNLFWGILGMLIVVYFIILVVKYFMVNMSIVMNSTVIHKHMTDYFIRGPISFFDVTRTGILTNKFTTDLGVLDNSLVIAFIDAVEGPILVSIAIGNMIHIDPWFAIPTGVLAIIIILFFIYARPAFIACKQLDLQQKGPVFHFYS